MEARGFLGREKVEEPDWSSLGWVCILGSWQRKLVCVRIKLTSLALFLLTLAGLNGLLPRF